LNIEVSLNTVVGVGAASARLVGSDNVLDGVVGDVVLALEARKIRWREVLSERFEERLGGSGVLDGTVVDVVVRSDEIGGGSSISSEVLSVVAADHGLREEGGRELDSVSNEIDELVDGLREAVLMSTDDIDVLGGRVEVEELGSKEFLSLGDGHTSDNEVTVGGHSELVDSVALEESLSTVEGNDITGQLADLLVSQVLAVLG
jgi:hypothetical protein